PFPRDPGQPCHLPDHIVSLPIPESLLALHRHPPRPNCRGRHRIREKTQDEVSWAGGKVNAETLAPKTRRDRVSHHIPSNLATPSDPNPTDNCISLAHLPLVRSRLLHSTSQGSRRTHWLHPSLLRRGFRKGVYGGLQGHRQDPD